MSEHWDLVVIGGGAAGYFSAITCAEKLADAGELPRVLILEKSPHVLGKVKISGGGRCNVTHACYDPNDLIAFYPRGSKSLLGPFHHWGPADTVQWFESRGVPLKTEADGRMFPDTDSSQTIIDCLTSSAKNAGVSIRVSEGVESITTEPNAETSHASDTEADKRFFIQTDKGTSIQANAVLLATGGTRLAAGAKLATALGHELEPNAPSLFAFNIKDDRLTSLPGVSVPHAHISVDGLKLDASGPLLITHHGLSGPGILRLSAWGARTLHDQDYRFGIQINWLPDEDVETTITNTRQTWGKRLVLGRAPFDEFPKRLWKSLCHAAGVSDTCIWSQLDKTTTQKLVRELTQGKFEVTGKSINKDEFVTCGGIKLPDVNLRTMESKLQPGLYFAGEILNIDGITGGFNFQNAWTTGYLAGMAIASS